MGCLRPQFATTPDDLDMHVIYDVSHNIAKVEQHMVAGRMKTLLVHRKVRLTSACPAPPLASPTSLYLLNLM